MDIYIRKEQEKNFHDKLRNCSFEQRWTHELEKIIKSDPLWANMKYYAVERKSRKLVLDWLEKNCNGRTVLDYCCGNGEDSIFMAQKGAEKVYGIDISEKSINNCKQRVKNKTYENKIMFSVMDAESLQFDDGCFDVVTEYGALHHLDLKKAFSEIVRVLKNNGKFICSEALGHNPFIHLYRHLTPHLRTAWEVDHILRKDDLKIAKNYFGNMEIKVFHLTTLCAVPFRNTSVFDSVLHFFEFIDGYLLRLPYIKWQAWQIVLIFSQPLKK